MDQTWLLPTSVHDFVPAGHVAHLIRDLMRTKLDLSAIMEPYERELRGYPPYHPAMMVALLPYACSRGFTPRGRLRRPARNGWT